MSFPMNELINAYLNHASSDTRIKFLQHNEESTLRFPISFSEDVLHLSIPNIEKQSILVETSSKDNLALESFLLSGVSSWDQNIYL